jgi:Kinesin motor domain
MIDKVFSGMVCNYILRRDKGNALIATPLVFNRTRPYLPTVSQDQVWYWVEKEVDNCEWYLTGNILVGKTHTMQGTEDEPGIIPRVAQYLFRRRLDYPKHTVKIHVSYMEIYKELVYDLLIPREGVGEIRSCLNWILSILIIWSIPARCWPLHQRRLLSQYIRCKPDRRECADTKTGSCQLPIIHG